MESIDGVACPEGSGGRLGSQIYLNFKYQQDSRIMIIIIQKHETLSRRRFKQSSGPET